MNLLSDFTAGIKVHKAEALFNKNTPFRIYSLENNRISKNIVHIHHYMQIWYVRHGHLKHIVNKTNHMLIKGNIFVLSPYITHKIKLLPGENASIYGCEFTPALINENIAYLKSFLAPKGSIKPGLQLGGSIQAKVESLFEDMLYEFNNKFKHYEINIKADLLKLLALISREYDRENSDPHRELHERYKEAVASAIKFIDENYTDKIYIRDACKIAMVSQPYFSYLFRYITGKTFVEYINKLRISKAIDIMCRGNTSVTETCFAAGFRDAAYFSRVFKRETGFSPLQYKNIINRPGIRG